MLRNLAGLDHVVVTVADLEAAAAGWRALGFTLAPRGTHSAHIGTGNHTMVFEADYVELLGVLAPTPQNRPTRDYLARSGGGVERIAMRLADAEAGAAELADLGIAVSGPVDFGRPVTRPDGSEVQARFRTIFWPTERAPAGVRLFACQHLTPEAVWIPELTRHANTARRVRRLEFVSADPAAAAAEAAALTGSRVEPVEGGHAVPTAPARARLVFRDRAGLAAAHPGVPLDGLPQEGAAVLVLGVADLEAARRALGSAALPGLGVAAAASGVLVAFESDAG